MCSDQTCKHKFASERLETKQTGGEELRRGGNCWTKHRWEGRAPGRGEPAKKAKCVSHCRCGGRNESGAQSMPQHIMPHPGISAPSRFAVAKRAWFATLSLVAAKIHTLSFSSSSSTLAFSPLVLLVPHASLRTPLLCAVSRQCLSLLGLFLPPPTGTLLSHLSEGPSEGFANV